MGFNPTFYGVNSMAIIREYLTGVKIEVVNNDLIIDWANVRKGNSAIFWDKESIPLLLADIINQCDIDLCALTQLVAEAKSDFNQDN